MVCLGAKRGFEGVVVFYIGCINYRSIISYKKRRKLQTKAKSSTNIAKDTLYKIHMSITGIMHEKISLVNGIGDIWTSKC
ncbi:hypothetical protein DsansV1_C04g0039141 [Dioscorea sansibarensis]